MLYCSVRQVEISADQRTYEGYRDNDIVLVSDMTESETESTYSSVFHPVLSLAVIMIWHFRFTFLNFPNLNVHIRSGC